MQGQRQYDIHKLFHRGGKDKGKRGENERMWGVFLWGVGDKIGGGCSVWEHPPIYWAYLRLWEVELVFTDKLYVAYWLFELLKV